MSARLAAISGKLKGAIFDLHEAALIIGRETAANVCLADAAVSRRHSKIEKKDGDFVITDLESLNGTFVNNVPVRSRVLEHGDRVRIARWILRPNAGWELQEAPVMLPPNRFVEALAAAARKGVLVSEPQG